MKARNLMMAFITVWLMSLGNLAWSNDDGVGTLAPDVSVNINTDSAEMIAENLSGVGISRAEAIVAYRENYGPFYSAEELTAVRGIGKNTVEKNADRIVVE
jgi:competence protein ComEA